MDVSSGQVDRQMVRRADRRTQRGEQVGREGDNKNRKRRDREGIGVGEGKGE